MPVGEVLRVQAAEVGRVLSCLLYAVTGTFEM